MDDLLGVFGDVEVALAKKKGYYSTILVVQNGH